MARLFRHLLLQSIVRSANDNSLAHIVKTARGLEVSWLLHHDTPGEDRQIWLYGTEGGTHLPKCEVYQTNKQTKQLYNRSLQLTKDQIEPHALQCIEFAQAILDGGPSPVPAEQSLQVMTILDAVYKSQETGREVVLD